MAVIKRFQTLADFACQHGGNIESLLSVAVLNGISPTANVEPGTVLKLQVIDIRQSQFFLTNKAVDITSQGSDTIQGGIGYMQIGTNFIVS
jgi:hypothetical protein